MRTGNIVICLFVSVLPVTALVLWLCAGAGSHLRCFCVEQVATSPGTTPSGTFRAPGFRIPRTAIPYGRAGFSRTKRVLMINWCGKEGFSVPNWDKLQAVFRFIDGIYTYDQSFERNHQSLSMPLKLLPFFSQCLGEQKRGCERRDVHAKPDAREVHKTRSYPAVKG